MQSHKELLRFMPCAADGSVCCVRHVLQASQAYYECIGPVQAVEALSTSCSRDLQGLNTRIHCPENGQTVDLSEGAASLRMVRL